MMFFHVAASALQQSLMFLPLAFGVYLSYQVLVVTDISVEGSFVLGAAIFARLFTLGFNQIFSMIAAMLGGIVVGIGITMMQRYAKINSLIAGIIGVFMLYSVNFAVMGQPNIGLLDPRIFLQSLQSSHPIGLWIFLIGFVLVLSALLVLFLHSRLGLLLRAFGVNALLLKRLGRNPTLYLCIGLAISHILSALCGVVTSQFDGYADINMGLGMAVTAIGSVVIGNKLIRSFILHTQKYSATLDLFCCLVGAYLYFLILNVFLAMGINPIYLKFLLGLILVLFLSTAHYSRPKGYIYEIVT